MLEKHHFPIRDALEKAIAQQDPLDKPLAEIAKIADPQRSYILHDGLCVAARVDHRYIYRLIAAGAPIELPRAKYPSSALVHAAMGNNTKSITTLLTYPININFKDDRAPDAEGRTALHAAVNAGSESVEALLKAGADPTITMTMRSTQEKLTPKDVMFALRKKQTPFLIGLMTNPAHKTTANSILDGYHRSFTSLEAAEIAWAAKTLVCPSATVSASAASSISTLSLESSPPASPSAASSNSAASRSIPARTKTVSPDTAIFYDVELNTPAAAAPKPAASAIMKRSDRFYDFVTPKSHASILDSRTPLLAPKPIRPADIAREKEALLSLNRGR